MLNLVVLSETLKSEQDFKKKAVSSIFFSNFEAINLI